VAINLLFAGILVMKLLYVFLVALFYLPQQSFDEAVDSLKTKLDTVEGREKVRVLNNIADKYSSLAPKKGMDYGKSSIELAEKLGYSEGVADASEIIGSIYYQLGDFEHAIQYYLKSLKVFRKEENKNGIATVYNQIGKCYRDMSNFEKALEYHNKALKINEEIDNKSGIANSYNNIGICYYSSEEYKKVLEYFKKALEINRKLDNKRGISSTLNNIAISYSSFEKYHKALDAFQRSLDINRKFGDKGAIATTLNNIGNLHIHLENYDKAEEYLRQSAEISEELGTKNLSKINYEAFANLYYAKGNFKKSIEYFHKYSSLKDSLFSAQSDERIAKMQAIYDLEAKERKIELLKKDNKIKKQNNRILILALSSIAVVAAFLIYIFYTRVKNSRNKQLLLQKEKEIAELQNKRQKEQYQKELDLKDRELASITMHILHKNEMLNQFREKLSEIVPDEKGKKYYKEITSLIDQTVHLDKDWENFALHFEKVHPEFFEKLQAKFPSLTKKELKQCAYLRINLSTKEIATLLNITVRGVEKARSRIKVKMDLDKDTDLYDYLRNF
jgi:tetratricopeptide (TPR) repeat protein